MYKFHVCKYCILSSIYLSFPSLWCTCVNLERHIIYSKKIHPIHCIYSVFPLHDPLRNLSFHGNKFLFVILYNLIDGYWCEHPGIYPLHILLLLLNLWISWFSTCIKKKSIDHLPTKAINQFTHTYTYFSTNTHTQTHIHSII